MKSKKDWIIVVIVLAIFSVLMYVMVQKPAFLFGTDSESSQGNLIEDYPGNIPEGWQIVNIENLGMIAIPKTLEVREEGSTLDVLSKSYNEVVYKISGLDEPNTDSSMVIQQAGLDAREDDSFASYARIMINIYNLESDELPKRSERLNLSNEDLQLLKEDSDSTLEEASEYFGCSIGETTIDEVYVNRMNALKFTYSRTCRDNPEIYVEQYKFFNSDQIVEIILSYRLTESDRWEKDFSRIIDTFILTN